MATILTRIAYDLGLVAAPGDPPLPLLSLGESIRKALDTIRCNAPLTLDGGDWKTPARLGKATLGIHPGRLLGAVLRWPRWHDAGLRIHWDRGADMSLYGGRVAAHWGDDHDLSISAHLPLLGFFGATLTLPEHSERLARFVRRGPLQHARELGVWVGQLTDDVKLQIEYGDPDRHDYAPEKPWWKRRPIELCLDPRRWLLGRLLRVELSRVESEEILPLPDRLYPCRVEVVRYREVRERLARFAWAGETYHSNTVSFTDAEVDDGYKKGPLSAVGASGENAQEAIGCAVGHILSRRKRYGWEQQQELRKAINALGVAVREAKASLSPQTSPDPLRAALWDAVNRYARSCGGKTDGPDAPGGLERQAAVCDVERAVSDLRGKPEDMGAEPPKDPERAEWLARQDAELVERAVRATHTHSPQAQPLWAVVKHVFNTGSQVAQALCRRFGRDPDEDIAGLVDEDGTCATCGVTACPTCGGMTATDGYCKDCYTECVRCAKRVPAEEILETGEEGDAPTCVTCVRELAATDPDPKE